MAHTESRRPVKNGGSNGQQLSADAELAVIRRRAEYLKEHPAALRKVMQRVGIIDRKGKLTREYGG